MRNKINVLGVEFDNLSMNEATNQIIDFIRTGSKVHKVYTANPEFVMLADKNKNFKDVLNQGELVVPDGIGVVIASKLLKTPLKERVAGYDLVLQVFEKMQDQGLRVYFLGSSPGVAALAAKKIKSKYKGLRIVGTRNGYFMKEEEKTIVEEINQREPDILLVGLGAPKQERFIHQYQEVLKAKVCIGVGGALDGFSGRIKRAPKWMIRLNLEWLYRLLKQPKRFVRYLQLPLFLCKVIKKRLTIRKPRKER